MGGANSTGTQENGKQMFEAKFSSFQKAAVGVATPPLYDPPQLRPQTLRSYWCGLAKINVMDKRAPLFSSCAKATVCMGAPCCNIDTFQMSAPDETFKKLLANCHPDCPDMLRGVWWMQDNTDCYSIVTLQDGIWSSKKSGVKNCRYNWSADYGTCYGAIGITCAGGKMLIEVSDDGKWVCFLKPGYKTPEWAYVMQPGDELKRPSGEVVDCPPGDLVRMNFDDAYNPSSAMYYQYRLRRIAYYDEAGNLVKTDAYNEYLKSAMAPMPHQGCCDNYCLSNLTYAEIAENFDVVNDQQSIIYYPPAVDLSHGTSSRELTQQSQQKDL